MPCTLTTPCMGPITLYEAVGTVSIYACRNGHHHVVGREESAPPPGIAAHHKDGRHGAHPRRSVERDAAEVA